MEDLDRNESSSTRRRTNRKNWSSCEDLDMVFSSNPLHG